MLADQRFFIAKAIREDDGVHVLTQHLAVVAMNRMHRLSEVGEFHASYYGVWITELLLQKLTEEETEVEEERPMRRDWY